MNIESRYTYPLFIVLIVLVVFSLSANYPIFSDWDDQVYILQNPYLKLNFNNIVAVFSKPYFHMYHPLTMVSYMIDYEIWGFKSIGYHLQNIFWHIIFCITVFKIMKKLGSTDLLAFLLCLFFSIHPQRVESVVWLSERKDVLSAAFYSLSFYFYIKETNYSKCAAFFFYILALLSKPSAVSLPVLLLFYEIFSQKKRGAQKIKKTVYNLFPYFLILVLMIPLIIVFQKIPPYSYSIEMKFFFLLHNFIWYIKSFFFPLKVYPIYPLIHVSTLNWWMIISGYIGLFSILLAVLFKGTNRVKSAFILFLLGYTVCFLPTSGIVPFSIVNYADRWSYLPSAVIVTGLSLAITAYFKDIRNDSNYFLKKRFLISMMTIYILVIGFKTILYSYNWSSPYEIFKKSCDAKNPNIAALDIMARYEIENHNYNLALYLASKIKNSPFASNPYNQRADFIIGTVAYLNKDYRTSYNLLSRVYRYNKNVQNIFQENLLYSRLVHMLDSSIKILSKNDSKDRIKKE